MGKTKTILLFISIKFFEFSFLLVPYFLYLILGLIFPLLTAINSSESLKFALGNFVSNFSHQLPLPLYLLVFLPIFLAPATAGHFFKEKKLVKKYWLFSSAADTVFLIFFLIQPCDSGLFISFCDLGRILLIAVFLLILLVRSFGLVLSFFLLKKVK